MDTPLLGIQDEFGSAVLTGSPGRLLRAWRPRPHLPGRRGLAKVLDEWVDWAKLKKYLDFLDNEGTPERQSNIHVS